MARRRWARSKRVRYVRRRPHPRPVDIVAISVRKGDMRTVASALPIRRDGFSEALQPAWRESRARRCSNGPAPARRVPGASPVGRPRQTTCRTPSHRSRCAAVRQRTPRRPRRCRSRRCVTPQPIRDRRLGCVGVHHDVLDRQRGFTASNTPYAATSRSGIGPSDARRPSQAMRGSTRHRAAKPRMASTSRPSARRTCKRRNADTCVSPGPIRPRCKRPRRPICKPGSHADGGSERSRLNERGIRHRSRP